MVQKLTASHDGGSCARTVPLRTVEDQVGGPFELGGRGFRAISTLLLLLLAAMAVAVVAILLVMLF